jgi:hypothetical protein
VAIPPKTWSLGQDGAWFLLQGLNSGFANVSLAGRSSSTMRSPTIIIIGLFLASQSSSGLRHWATSLEGCWKRWASTLITYLKGEMGHWA